MMMNDSQLSHSFPDPAWDYYMTWCRLHRAKAQIQQTLAHLINCEVANSDADQLAYSFISDAIATLQQALPPDEPT